MTPLITTRCIVCGATRHDWGAAASELEGWTIISSRAYCGARRCRAAALAARRDCRSPEARERRRRRRRGGRGRRRQKEVT